MREEDDIADDGEAGKIVDMTGIFYSASLIMLILRI